MASISFTSHHVFQLTTATDRRPFNRTWTSRDLASSRPTCLRDAIIDSPGINSSTLSIHPAERSRVSWLYFLCLVMSTSSLGDHTLRRIQHDSVNARHFVTLVRAGALFTNGKLVEDPDDTADNQ